MLKKSTILLTLLLVLVFNFRLFAQQPNFDETPDYFDMSLDELM